MSDQWEGPERRQRGRPTLADEAAEITLKIRVTKTQFAKLQAAARNNQHEHLATYLRELIDAGVLESQDDPVFSRAS